MTSKFILSIILSNMNTSSCKEDCRGVLIAGATGYLGSLLASASISHGLPTYALVRPQTLSSKETLIKHFQSQGIHIVQGDVKDENCLLEALKNVDVVISVFNNTQTMDQLHLINAIKIGGQHIKRFVPSEFGMEYTRITALPPFQRLADKKLKIRKEIADAEIPYTIFSANFFTAYFVDRLLDPSKNPTEVMIYGDGNIKACFNLEEDIAAMVIKAAIDPRTINKIVTYKPRKNMISQEELVTLWETKTGKTLKRSFVTSQQLEELSASLPPPENVQMSILHSIYVKGDQENLEIGADLEASQLFPEYASTSVEDYLDSWLANPSDPTPQSDLSSV